MVEPTPFPETRRALSELGLAEPYRPNWSFEGDHIDDTHRWYAVRPRDGAKILAEIEGSLRIEDARKLYELAYFANGPILELGCNRGLSTSILAKAQREAAPGRKPESIDTVDLDRKCVSQTRKNLAALGLGDQVTVHHGEAAAVCRKLAADSRKFDLVFVDHSHAAEPVRQVCVELASLTNPGCFVVFHDYNDRRNGDKDATEYGVFQGVEEGFDETLFEFFGLCGCCGVFRRRA